MATPALPQPTYTLVLTHDEIIALAGALSFLRENFLARVTLAAMDLTTIKNIEAIAEKLPDEKWFEEVTRA